MLPPARTVRISLALLTALATVLVTAFVGLSPAQAAPVTKQRIYGAINFPHHDNPRLKLQWFDKNWGYLGSQSANGGGYSIKVPAGTYHLQFVDQRPSYDTSKYAPTNVTVRVGSHSVTKNVTMKRGASITGVAKGGGKRLAGATVIAANQSEQSFSTTANDKGQFAVGGLPAGKYCLFTYDRAKRYVDKCTWAGGVNYGQSKNKIIKLKKRAGSLTVFVDTAEGNSAPSSNLTVTSKATGQWWTAKVRKGKAVFNGVFPSRYKYKYDGGGIWLSATGAIRGGNVHANKMAFGDVQLTKRGGWVAGNVVDAAAPGSVLKGAHVLLFSASGQQLASATSNKSGYFKLSGPLTTQTVTLVLDPDPNSGGFMDTIDEVGDPVKCVFKHTAVPGTAQVRSGKETFVGDIAIKRAADQPDPDCDPA